MEYLPLVLGVLALATPMAISLVVGNRAHRKQQAFYKKVDKEWKKA